MRLVVVLFLAALSLSTARAQRVTFSPEERRVITIADERRNPDSLLIYLSSANERVAWRAAIGLANLGDTLTRQGLIGRLKKEKRNDVRDAIAFALGVLGPNASVFDALQDVAGDQPDYTFAEALGRTVPQSELKSEIKDLRGSLGKNVAQFGIEVVLRKMYSNELADLASKLADNNDPEVRWRAAYIFSRFEDSLILSSHTETLHTLLLDLGSPEARMFAATAYGRLHNAEAESSVLRALRGESDWRVKVNSLLALTRMSKFDSSIFQAFRNATEFSTNDDHTSEHVAMTAFTALTQMTKAAKLSSADSAIVRNWLETFEISQQRYLDLPRDVRSSAITPLALLSSKRLRPMITDAVLSKEHYSMQQALSNIWAISDTTVFKQFLMAVARADAFELPDYINGLSDIWVRGQKDTAFRNAAERSHIASGYRYMMLRLPLVNDQIGVVAAILPKLEDSTIISDATFRSEARTSVVKYLTQFNDPDKRDQLLLAVHFAGWLGDTAHSVREALYTVNQSAIKWADKELVDSTRSALMQLGEHPQAIDFSRSPSVIDWSLLENSPDSISINAPGGAIVVRLDKYNAPLSSLNFIKLSQSFYFNNQVIHRLVPNFVIQSGDPTGTGEGGPHYAIRTEISPAEFSAAGVLGMASAGKDTEGSQWFITHLPTPHLDSRYTVFGHVVRGMENVNNAHIFDLIESIRLVK